MSEGFFGERVAARYDERSAEASRPEAVDPVLDVLEAYAAGGGALELAVGTGRIALPLSARGVRVAGIDDSEAMLARLRAKPGAERIEIARGDMTITRMAGEFSLVYLVFNTISNLTSQDAQVACFENAAAHLRAGGWRASPGCGSSTAGRAGAVSRSGRSARRTCPYT